MRTVLAMLDMTTECGGAADLNCRHNTALGEVDVAFVGCTPCLAMTAEDIRHLQVRSKYTHSLQVTNTGSVQLTVQIRWAPYLSQQVDGSAMLTGVAVFASGVVDASSVKFSIFPSSSVFVDQAHLVAGCEARRKWLINHRNQEDLRLGSCALHYFQRTEASIDGLARANLRFSEQGGP